jgi:predicted negative regulator of RcsB-dependent stress response
MPPTTHRRKITRKELKQPDEFATLFDSAYDFLLANLQKVLISAGVVVAAGAIVVGLYYYERSRDENTALRFNRALAALTAGQNKQAELDFKSLADLEPNRRLGRLARFYLANAYLADNDPAKARDSLVQFLEEEHDPMFSSLAWTNLGVVYESLSEWSKAAGAYRNGASAPGPEQIRAELAMARMLAKAGDKQGAIGAYREFLAAHPFAQQRQDVVESLALLGAPAEATPPRTAAAGGPLPVVTH